MTDILVTSAEYLGDHTIKIGFSDGTEKTVCFLDFLEKFAHPDYARYIDESDFKNFNIIDGNINWNDYHMIFTIDALHTNHSESKATMV